VLEGKYRTRHLSATLPGNVSPNRLRSDSRIPEGWRPRTAVGIDVPSPAVLVRDDSRSALPLTTALLHRSTLPSDCHCRGIWSQRDRSPVKGAMRLPWNGAHISPALVHLQDKRDRFGSYSFVHCLWTDPRASYRGLALYSYLSH
jgi:hypothetical protein